MIRRISGPTNAVVKPKPAPPPAAAADTVALSKPRVYYDASRDQQDVAKYYRGLDENLGPAELFQALSQLLAETHVHKLGYNPDTNLYPWVDLRPSLRLDSLYSAETAGPGTPVRVKNVMDYRLLSELSKRDLKKMTLQVRESRLRNLGEQAAQWAKALQEGGTDAVAIAQKLAVVETQQTFNCEHVVAQKWFDSAGPMVGDLHHLFTCRAESNQQRSTRLFKDVDHTKGPLTNGEGYAPLHENAFEPAAGKGAIARATLYFLMRYPGKIGDRGGEYTAEDVQQLLRWNRENPVSLYEHHRNQAIFELQGNRNPLIDHPEWAEKIDFRKGLGRVRLPAQQLPHNPWPRQFYKG